VQNSLSHDPLGSRIPRVAIVGAGFVGSTTAYALMMSGIAAEIVLIDRDLRRADGQGHREKTRRIAYKSGAA
jgi:malate/lactate dehydrogenase